MITMTTLALIGGTRLRVEPTVPGYVHEWAKRPSRFLAGASQTDNSTGVSAVERRRR